MIITTKNPKKTQNAQRMSENELSKIGIGCAMDVHKALGPGLLESAYQECLYYKIKNSEFMLKRKNNYP